MIVRNPSLETPTHCGSALPRVEALDAVMVLNQDFASQGLAERSIVQTLLARTIRGLEADVAALMAWGAGFTDALIDALLDALTRQPELVRTLAAAVAADPSLLVQEPACRERGFDGSNSEDDIARNRREMVRFAVEGLLLFSLTVDRARHRTLKIQLRGKLRELVACCRASFEGPPEYPVESVLRPQSTT